MGEVSEIGADLGREVESARVTRDGPSTADGVVAAFHPGVLEGRSCMAGQREMACQLLHPGCAVTEMMATPGVRPTWNEILDRVIRWDVQR